MTTPSDTDANLNVGAASISSTEDAPAALQEIYDSLVHKAETAMAWYESRQRKKKFGARFVRSAAILLGALTAIIPSLIAMLPEQLFEGTGHSFSAVRLNPVATITGVAAATAILFDKFYGFSSSWGRFITTYQKIQQDLENFRIGWRKEILKLNANMPPSDEQVLAVYDFLGAFLKSINDAVRAETEAWLTEFKGAIGDIDKTVEAQRSGVNVPHASSSASAATKGSLSIELADLDTLDDSRWTLRLDTRKAEVKVGQRTASVPMLDPGIYKLRIAASRQGRPVASEYPVQVKAGEVTTVKVDKLG